MERFVALSNSLPYRMLFTNLIDHAITPSITKKFQQRQNLSISSIHRVSSTCLEFLNNFIVVSMSNIFLIESTDFNFDRHNVDSHILSALQDPTVAHRVTVLLWIARLCGLLLGLIPSEDRFHAYYLQIAKSYCRR